MRWSVSVVAVSAFDGIAFGPQHYGAQLVMEAADRASAVELATATFVRAAAQAGLPQWPITDVGAISEAEEELE